MERYRHDFPLFRLLSMAKHLRFPWGTEKSKLWNDVECTRTMDLILLLTHQKFMTILDCKQSNIF